MLWRRETRKTDGQQYVEGTSANSVLVRQYSDDPRASTVLYTEFHDAGKIPKPTAKELAKHAIQSVGKAKEGKDGVSYLMNAIACGIETPLTLTYQTEILRLTGAQTLQEALERTRTQR